MRNNHLDWSEGKRTNIVGFVLSRRDKSPGDLVIMTSLPGFFCFNILYESSGYFLIENYQLTERMKKNELKLAKGAASCNL